MNPRAIKWSIVGSLGLITVAVWLFQTGPRRTFERLVLKPVPASVDSIEEGSFSTLDSVFRVLRFRIGPPDIRRLLDLNGYRPVGESELKRWDSQAGSMASITQEDYLNDWEGRIQALTKLKVHFTKDWQAYILKEGHGQKFILCNTNISEAVFVADAH